MTKYFNIRDAINNLDLTIEQRDFVYTWMQQFQVDFRKSGLSFVFYDDGTPSQVYYSPEPGLSVQYRSSATN